jgi:hypothetical protein
MFQSEHGKSDSSFMPEKEAQKYQNVPPLVTVSNGVNQTWNRQKTFLSIIDTLLQKNSGSSSFCKGLVKSTEFLV